jgi:hypothetical protein
MLPMILRDAPTWICCISAFSSLRLLYIYATAEQFDFGFAAFMMYFYVADGESKTSHYSIATGFMALGMMLPEWRIHTRIFRLRKLLYLGVSSHYSWINSVKT